MVFATWNIGSLFSDYNHNIKIVENLIRDLNADIVCLQEFPNVETLYDGIFKWGDFRYIRYLEYSPSHVCTGKNMGIAIFSKGPLRDIESFFLPKPQVTVSYHGQIETLHNKAFLAVSMESKEGRYLIVSGHGFPFYRYGLDGQDELFRFVYVPLDGMLSQLMHKQVYDHIIIGGDFNHRDIALYMPNLKNSFYDIFQDIPTRPSGRKTDAVFLPKAIMVRSQEVIKSDMDHFLLKVEL